MFPIFNPFPDLLTYSFFAPTILRIVFGIYLIMFGYGKVAPKKAEDEAAAATNTKLFPSPIVLKIIGVIQLILGVCFIIGFEVQIASIIAIVIFLGAIILYNKFNPPKKLSRSIFFLLIVIAISLLLTGAGMSAIDLPL